MSYTIYRIVKFISMAMIIIGSIVLAYSEIYPSPTLYNYEVPGLSIMAIVVGLIVWAYFWRIGKLYYSDTGNSPVRKIVRVDANDLDRLKKLEREMTGLGPLTALIGISALLKTYDLFSGTAIPLWAEYSAFGLMTIRVIYLLINIKRIKKVE